MVIKLGYKAWGRSCYNKGNGDNRDNIRIFVSERAVDFGHIGTEVSKKLLDAVKAGKDMVNYDFGKLVLNKVTNEFEMFNMEIHDCLTVFVSKYEKEIAAQGIKFITSERIQPIRLELDKNYKIWDVGDNLIALIKELVALDYV